MNLLERIIAVAFASCLGGTLASAQPKIFEWDRGFGLRIPGEPLADMFLWIYEWNMFEAMNAGPHTHGHTSCRVDSMRTEPKV